MYLSHLCLHYRFLLQAILAFEKSMEFPASGRKTKSDSSLKFDVTLPPIAKRLIRSLKGNVEANTLKVIVSRCVSLLTDAQIRALPDVARKLVVDKKIAIENRKKMYVFRTSFMLLFMVT